MKDDNVLQEKSYQFALRIVEIGYQLINNKEFILSKQLIRSGTSIGANVEEAIGAYSRKDFQHKLNIAYKEARETKYWLRLLRDSKKMEPVSAQAYLEEVLRISGSILKTLNS